MRQHALDGEVGLAGIGGAEHRSHACAAATHCSGRLRGKRNRHYASKLAPGSVIDTGTRAFCITLRRLGSAWLSIRTSLERIAPESLTRGLYDFVHGDIWPALQPQLQDGVVTGGFKRVLSLSKVNIAIGLESTKESSETSTSLGLRAVGR